MALQIAAARQARSTECDGLTLGLGSAGSDNILIKIRVSNQGGDANFLESEVVPGVRGECIAS